LEYEHVGVNLYTSLSLSLSISINLLNFASLNNYYLEMTDSDSCPATSYATDFFAYLINENVTLVLPKSEFRNNFSFLRVMLR
jgi:hypothetical protein